MPLTPEDVSNKRFATSRLFREGYDMTEVDQFLDEIEAELRRLLDENGGLRGSSGQTPPSPSSDSKTEPEPTTEPESEAPASAADEAPAAQHPADEKAPVSADESRPSSGGPEVIEVTTTEQASAAVARMLEIAGRNADELLAEARSQAEAMVAEATRRAEELDSETEQRRSSIVADLERDHQALKSEVEDLRAFEREYRAQLRNYFQQQLDALDAQGGGVTLAEDLHEDEGEIGSRLRSILESEEQGENQGETGEPGDPDEAAHKEQPQS